ncbi:MAG: hypothetical protein R6U17_02810 [Thermoplasmata archaeon]
MWLVATIISDNFMNIFYVIAIIIILYIVGRVVMTHEKEKMRLKSADLRLKAKKMDMLEKEQYIKGLKEASMVLKDDEKTRIDEIERDKAILSRRSLALMDEIEQRMQRLERGADNAKLLKTLKEINETEDELFGKEGGKK